MTGLTAVLALAIVFLLVGFGLIVESASGGFFRFSPKSCFVAGCLAMLATVGLIAFAILFWGLQTGGSA